MYMYTDKCQVVHCTEKTAPIFEPRIFAITQNEHAFQSIEWRKYCVCFIASSEVITSSKKSKHLITPSRFQRVSLSS